MTIPEYMAEINIEIPYATDDVPDKTLDDLFDSIADLLYDWAEGRNIDPFMSGAYRKPIPEWLSETEDPPQDSLACEADSVSYKPLYEALLAKFKRLGLSHAVADDLAERAADVAVELYGHTHD